MCGARRGGASRGVVAVACAISADRRSPRDVRLCLHTTSSAPAGYRRALEGWARAGITQVELHATIVEDFLRTQTRADARAILSDNGLTAVHGAVEIDGLFEPGPHQAAALEQLRMRLDLFASLGIPRAYAHTGGTRRLSIDDYGGVAEAMRRAGDIAAALGMGFNVEFVRSSPYMATLPTTLRVLRQAAHPNVGVVLDCYHFWSGLNRPDDLDDLRAGEVRHVHFQDVPDLPRELLDSASRVLPGEGVAPLESTLRLLAALGYAGPLSVELFLPRYQAMDPEALARRIREVCDPVLRRAGVADEPPVC